MRLIAKKVCSFGGKKFYIGKEVPAELVLNPSLQIKLGVLVEVPDIESGSGENGSGSCDAQATLNPAMTIVVQIDGDTVELEPTDDGIQQIFTVLVGKAANAEATIKNMDDEDSLRLLKLSTTTQSVKKLAEKRIQELSAGEE